MKFLVRFVSTNGTQRGPLHYAGFYEVTPEWGEPGVRYFRTVRDPEDATPAGKMETDELRRLAGRYVEYGWRIEIEEWPGSG